MMAMRPPKIPPTEPMAMAAPPVEMLVVLPPAAGVADEAGEVAAGEPVIEPVPVALAMEAPPDVMEPAGVDAGAPPAAVAAQEQTAAAEAITTWAV